LGGNDGKVTHASGTELRPPQAARGTAGSSPRHSGAQAPDADLIVASHAQAVAFVRNYAEVSVKQRFKTVVTSAAGYPLDRTYYQTVKGMVGPLDILEPGGRLIVASECSEGLGSPAFVEAQRRLMKLGSEEFLRRILLKSHADIDEWRTQMQLKPMAVGTLQLYSTGLSPAQHSLTGVASIDSVRSAVLESIAASGDPAVAVAPEGPYVVPFAAEK
jgi:lactate racemase